MRVNVTGNIATGKSTLATSLAQCLEIPVFLETDVVKFNPYWADFCEEPAKWAFHCQIYFLRSTLEAQVRNPGNNVFDFGASACLPYTAAMHDMGWLSARDYDEYLALFDLAAEVVAPPDVHVFLFARPATLRQRVRTRERAGETSMCSEYMEFLCERWDAEKSSLYNTGRHSRVLLIDTEEFDTRTPIVAESVALAAKNLAEGTGWIVKFGGG